MKTLWKFTVRILSQALACALCLLGLPLAVAGLAWAIGNAVSYWTDGTTPGAEQSLALGALFLAVLALLYFTVQGAIGITKWIRSEWREARND